MKKQKMIMTALMVAGGCIGANADVVINEIMQSNVYGIMDDLNDFPDSWVELYNDSDTPVNIGGYRMHTKEKFKSAYTLPSAVIPAHGHLIVYCDKAETGLHTDFRVDSGKGDVYLFDADGNTIDHVNLKKQPAPDIAYGRETDGADTWGYELTPTPGAANSGGTTSTVLGTVGFSVPGGVWKDNQNISLLLELPEKAPEGTVIYYTTNGSEPTAATGTLYTGQEIKVNKSCVVRAKAVCDGALSIPSNAQSYLFLGRDVQIPVISIAINDEYLYDTKIGILSEGENPPMWGENLNANYFKDWRRPCNIEYFVAEGGEAVINQLCETRVQGGYTRRNALKSLAVYANKRFGTKRLEYEFWQKDKPGITDNKSIILRNGGNDFSFCYVRDGLMHRIIGRNTEIEWQGYTPAIVFINGQYHAMLAIRERSNEDNISANFNGLEDIDMFENWEECKAGDETAINEFKEYIKSEHTFDEWSEYINIESYTNLMALNYWVYNTDFPHNNVVMWRKTDGTDSRWRWLVKDCDFGLGIYGHDAVNKDYATFLNTNPDHQEATGYTLWQNLMKCDEFKQYFLNHLIAYTGDFLNDDTFNEYIDEIVEENHGEQMISHQKWAGNGWWTPDLNANILSMRDWVKKRQTAMRTIIKNGFKLGSLTEIKVNQDLTDEQKATIKISYDDVNLTKGTFKGYDYVGRTIKLEGAEGSNIVGWTVKVGTNEPETINTPVLEYAIASSKSTSINAIIDDAGITDVTYDAGKSFQQQRDHIYYDGRIEIYDATGLLVTSGYRMVTIPQHGVFIVKTGNGRTSKVVW